MSPFEYNASRERLDYLRALLKAELILTTAEIGNLSKEFGNALRQYDKDHDGLSRAHSYEVANILINNIFSEDSGIARSAAYGMLSNIMDPAINCGLDPSKDPENLTEAENEKFYQAIVKFLEQSKIDAIYTLDATATGEYIGQDPIIEIFHQLKRVMPFTINGSKIQLNSYDANDGNVFVSSYKAKRVLSQEFTAHAQDDDCMFTIRAKVQIPENRITDGKIPIEGMSPWAHAHRLVPITY